MPMVLYRVMYGAGAGAGCVGRSFLVMTGNGCTITPLTVLTVSHILAARLRLAHTATTGHFRRDQWPG